MTVSAGAITRVLAAAAAAAATAVAMSGSLPLNLGKNTDGLKDVYASTAEAAGTTVTSAAATAAVGAGAHASTAGITGRSLLRALSKSLKPYSRALAGIAFVIGANVAIHMITEMILSSLQGGQSFGWASNMQPQGEKSSKMSQAEREDAERLAAKLRKLPLSSHEKTIARSIVLLSETNAPGFLQIGGLESIVQDIQETVICPLCWLNNDTSKTASSSDAQSQPVIKTSANLLAPPKGVLLYGPPGCGKTMIARAIAKESGATFINLHASALTNMYFGESQKLVNALFSLARKIQPCIIFLDEIDAMLRSRQSSDHETTSMMKAEFLTLWDGLFSSPQDKVVVIGATNRPEDLDEAVLRRMPRRYHVTLPNATQRAEILKLILSDSNLVPDFDFDEVADMTNGFSGSDLKELCRNAAMIPLREIIKSTRESQQEKNENHTGSIKFELPEHTTLRPLSVYDFLQAALNQTSGVPSHA